MDNRIGRYTALLLACITTPVLAQWNFSDRIAVSTNHSHTIFHHLDAGGRKSIAVNDGLVAVVWEDNSSGSPQTYIAQKHFSEKIFTPPAQLGSGKRSFEPVITAFMDKGFLACWEQDQTIWCRTIHNSIMSMPVKISHTPASQVSITTFNRDAIVVWREQVKNSGKLFLCKMSLADDTLVFSQPVLIEPEASDSRKSFPTVTATSSHIIVAWEDRRDGSTMIYSSRSSDGIHFTQPARVNEAIKKSVGYGEFAGVARPVSAQWNESHIGIAWLDKRAYVEGYSPYLSISDDHGKTYSVNQQIHDGFGEHVPKWHVALTANAHGLVIAAWDDIRDGNSDIWFSWQTRQGWSQNEVVTPASGSGEQISPAIVLDSKNKLHVVWLERGEDKIDRIYYTTGSVRASP